MPAGAAHTVITPVDLHVHSTCSVDGVSTIEDYARRAVNLGLAEVGLCEHVDLDPRDGSYGFFDPERYDREIAAARAAVPGVRLRQGVEITYQSNLEESLVVWLASHPWDYVIASVHLVDYPDGWAIISEPGAMADYFAVHNQQQAYGPYFTELLKAAESGLGDVLGHLDLVKRFGVRQYGPLDPTAFQEEIRQVLRAAARSGTGLEINTSGLRQSPAEPYPPLSVLRWFREVGGEVVTVGSDAHRADDLGSDIALALEMAQAAGFQAIATFEERRVRWIDL
jgi:histidinol-phosphatase (PHP family)